MIARSPTSRTLRSRAPLAAVRGAFHSRATLAALRGAFPSRLTLVASLAFLPGALLSAWGCGPERAEAVAYSDEPAAAPALEEELEVPPPPFSPGIYPCSGCHGMMTPNPDRRELTAFHTDIVLRHDEEHRWCLDCHDKDNRDQLHLASGEPVPFEESYRLCGQCHGEKYRDWRAGVHGRRTGKWNGHKTYLLCAHCHNPHDPHFRPLEPEPPPIPPAETVGDARRSEEPSAPAGIRPEGDGSTAADPGTPGGGSEG